MVDRGLAAIFAVGLVASFAILGVATGQPRDSNQHSGLALDYRTSTPVAASIKAWRNSSPSGSTGDCPQYGDAPVASFQSKVDGLFELAIDVSNPTYTVVYCASGYHPRVDRDLPNDPSGSRVIPTPALLWPIDDRPETTAAYSDTVQRRLIAALNELAYLRSVNVDAFNSTVAAYSKVVGGDQASTVQALADMTARWGR